MGGSRPPSPLAPHPRKGWRAGIVTPDEAAARARLRDARGFIFDMDGTLVLGDRVNHGLRPLPGAVEMLNWVRGRGLPYVVFTNGTNRAPAHFARPLRAAGLETVPPSEPADAAGVDAVLVGWFPEFTMPALEAACDAVWGGAE